MYVIPIRCFNRLMKLFDFQIKLLRVSKLRRLLPPAAFRGGCPRSPQRDRGIHPQGKESGTRPRPRNNAGADATDTIRGAPSDHLMYKCCCTIVSSHFVSRSCQEIMSRNYIDLGFNEIPKPREISYLILS